MGVLSEYIELVKQVLDGSQDGEQMVKKHSKEFKSKLDKVSEEDWEEVQEFLELCLKSKDREVIDNMATPVVDKRKLIKWKEHKEIFKSVFDIVIECGNSWNPDDRHCDLTYYDFMDKFIPLLKANQLYKKHIEDMKLMVELALSSTENMLLRLIVFFAENLPFSQNIEWTLNIFDLIYIQIQDVPEMKTSHDYSFCVSLTMIYIFRDTFTNPKLASKYSEHVAKLFNFCKDQEWIDPDNTDKRTIHHQICKDILEDYLCRHNSKKEIVEPCIKGTKELLECDDDVLSRDANNLISSLPGKLLLELDQDSAENMIESYISGENPLLITNLQQIYSGRPDKYHDKLEDIAEAMEDGQDWVLTCTCSIFLEIAKVHPEAVTDKCVAHIVKTLSVVGTAGIGLMPLVSVAAKFPERLQKYDKELEEAIYTHKNMSSQVAAIYLHLSHGSREKTERYLAKVVKAMKSFTDKNHCMGMMHTIGQMGSDYPDLLAVYEDYFKQLEDDAMLKDFAKGIIDMIHGRSLAKVFENVVNVQEDIENLDTRVTNTEENVENLSREVDQTKEGVAVLSQEVSEQGERLGELEEVVEETVDKVEEIDKKTLSHAPKWSRDVANLLNPATEHDWRLLASKLGYTNDDIRNWATQPDPCLSMFDEWFATHRTKEATHAILTQLDEMNRTDACMIVENALKQAEGVVEDEEVDYITPPPVFISYQWGVQDEVKLLKKHLEMAGFECWMDIGQMGGGDKLFEKIDTGIRAAKIVICCVTEKYAKSPNCNREVNLSVNLAKPIIPLLMEKMSWPPPGSMGPIFGEYLFIRFFARSGETARYNCYWPTAKFQELLMQLRYNVVPKQDIISEPYKDWWSPPEEIIVIKPKDKKEENKSGKLADSQKAKKETESSPDVFISYQWGKQPQIKALYKKLTLLGYSCWLDILQMGGGDSLYDKIDRGVRGCKVVLTCITSKYALSANCRREVSLADAIKKPIVPLLLEKVTWPPEGPMSMVFTQLLYIDFCKPDVTVQDNWECPQTKELVGKINIYVPKMAPPAIENSNEHKGNSVSKSAQPQNGNIQSSPPSKNEQIKTTEPEIVDTQESAKTPADAGNDSSLSRQEPKGESQSSPRDKTSHVSNSNSDTGGKRAQKSSSCNIL